MTLSDARILQSKRQKLAIIKFLIFIAVVAGVSVAIFCCTDYFQKYSVLYAVVIALLLLSVKLSKIYKLIQPKEFCGILEYSSVHTDMVKKYASHQAGTTYAATEVTMVDIIVKNEKGRKLSKTFKYDWRDIRVGQKVIILRFVDEIIL